MKPESPGRFPYTERFLRLEAEPLLENYLAQDSSLPKSSVRSVGATVLIDERAAFEVSGSREMVRLSLDMNVSSSSAKYWQEVHTQLSAGSASIRTLFEAASPEVQAQLKITTADWVGDLPWEMLCKADGSFLALSGNVHPIRTVPRMMPLSPLSTSLPLRILLVSPNPLPSLPIDSKAELWNVKKQLVTPENETKFSIKQLTGSRATRSTLENVLGTFLPHVVHYIGHGAMSSGEGNLLFSPKSESASADWISPAQLARILPLTTRLLCLSTCVTVSNYQLQGLGRFALAPGDVELPNIVANQMPVDRSTVQAFWSAFYLSLVDAQGDVTAAVAAGRAAVSRRRDAEPTHWASFRLVLRDQNGLSLSILSSGRTKKPLSLQAQQRQLESHYTSQVANRLAQRLADLGFTYEAKTTMEAVSDDESRRSGLVASTVLDEVAKLSGFE